MANELPLGFRAAGVYSGVKRNQSKLDLSLLVSDAPATAVGVYTQNVVHGAPVKLNRERTPCDSVRSVVINSGVANACTGPAGYDDALRMSEMVASAIDCQPTDVLVMSTGVIGARLPMEKIEAGIAAAAAGLGSGEAELVAAAKGMLTTDTCHKVCCRRIQADGVRVTVTGVAKGAAMIGPNMATMLAVVLTDAKLAASEAQRLLHDSVDESFNCISVDGHMSTSDTVLLLANGAAGGPELAGESLTSFRATLLEVCEELAQSIPADGEGADHLVTVEVHGCATRADAVKIAKTVSDSPLVKTAIAGNDPNWGRVVSAAGYAGVAFDPEKISLLVNSKLLYERGAPVEFDAAAISESMAADRNVSIVLLLDEGEASARFWTTDLTAEYVRLNADYHT